MQVSEPMGPLHAACSQLPAMSLGTSEIRARLVGYCGPGNGRSAEETCGFEQMECHLLDSCWSQRWNAWDAFLLLPP